MIVGIIKGAASALRLGGRGAAAVGRGSLSSTRAAGRLFSRAKGKLAAGGILGGGAVGLKGVIGGAFASMLGGKDDQGSAALTNGLSIGSDIEERPRESNVEQIKASDLFSAIEIDPVNIIPELGPEEGEYSEHLNLIIERVAKLEGQVATQNNLIAKLFGATDRLYDHEKDVELDRKRQASEDNIEKKKRKGGKSKIGQFAEQKTSTLTRILKGALGAVGLMASGLVAATTGEEGSAEANEENDIQFAELSPQEITEMVSAEIVSYSSTAVGATVGSRIMSDSVTESRRNRRNRARELAEKADDVETPKTAGAASATGATQAPRKASMYKRAIDKFKSIGASLAGKMKSTMETVRNFFNRLGAAGRFALKILGRVAAAVYAITGMIRFVGNTFDLYVKNEISEDEYHRLNKEQLDSLMTTAALPLFFGVVGGILGTVIPIPILGNAAGLTIGVILGLFAEKMYKRFGGDVILENLYNALFIGDTAKMKGLFDTIGAVVKNVYEGAVKVGDGAKFVYKYSGAKIAIDSVVNGVSWVRGVFGGGDEEGEVPMPSQEEVMSELNTEWANEDQQESWYRQYQKVQEMKSSEFEETRQMGERVEQRLLTEISNAKPKEWWQPEWADPILQQRWSNMHRTAESLKKNENISLRSRGEMQEVHLEHEIKTEHRRIFNTEWPGRQTLERDPPTVESPAPRNNLSGLRPSTGPVTYNPETGVMESGTPTSNVTNISEYQNNNISVNNQSRSNNTSVNNQSQSNNISVNNQTNNTGVPIYNDETIINNNDISYDVNEKDPNVIVLPAPQQRRRQIRDERLSAGKGPPTPIESASPTQSTSDRFVEVAYHT